MHAHRSSQRATVAIVGGESLLGKEIHDLLDSRKAPANVKLVTSLDAEEVKGASILTRGLDEPLVMASIELADLGTARVVVLAGSKASSEKAYQKFRGAKPVPAVVDVSGGLEDLAEARLRAPMVEPPGFDANAPVQTIAHPAAIALALLITHLQKAGPIRRSVVEIFEPVSERGQAGIEELQKQAVALLSFKPLPKDVFDAQISFNMLSQYGSDASLSLDAIEQKIDRHLASLLASSGAAMPSLRLIQAPVFHGYSISVWVEFDENPGMDAIFQALASGNIDVRTRDHEPPTNVGVAGQGGITVGTITQDRNQPRAWWFWLVADNLQIAAENTWEVVREYLE
ncbi:MAG TPA: Asd/ArgC dimerization domain-containing protein [Bryobacteraceae bacterium]|nr:Asd/ArgC dimerization domain-containing protein [Bryobacteraceae bacterium]